MVSVLVHVQVVATKIQKRAVCTVPPVMQGKCQCQANIVQCSDLDVIVPLTGGLTTTRLEISNSNLTIPPNAFQGWGLKQLILDNCNLTDSKLNADSFKGIEDKLLLLNIANNELTKLPEALSKMTFLGTLDVSGNPIDQYSFSEDILRDIGDTLISFTLGTKIGGTELTQWPTTLKHLTKLEELILTASAISIMPINAFHGFQGTLLRLKIAHTQLRSVPLAISRLRYLQELHIDHNIQIGDYGLRIPIIRGFLPFLNQISLIDDNITTFPEVLAGFEKLDQLIMDQNNLKFVSDKSAQSVSTIASLSLKNSGITRIPGAIQDITNLNILDLSNNSIHAIETNDLVDSKELYTLKMNNNPILYISDKAFKEQTKLRRLELKGVEIRSIPCAIESLLRNHGRGFLIIDLSDNTIECNCGLKWLFDIKNDRTIQTRFRVVGTCASVAFSLQDYIDSQLATCPSGINCADAH